MKIIHTADWHLGRKLHEYQLLTEQASLLHAWIDEIKALQPDLILHAGDLYDRSLPSQESVALADALLTRLSQEIGVPTLIISGNHDSGSRLNYMKEFARSANLYLCGLPMREIECVSVGEADIYMLPYSDYSVIREFYPQASIQSLYDALKIQIAEIEQMVKPERLNILMFHGYVTAYDLESECTGRDLSYSTSERPLTIGTQPYIPADLFKVFDYVALGHLHNQQQVGSWPIYYSGSPMKYSKSEAKQAKGYLEIDLTKNSLHVKKHAFKPARDLRIIHSSLADCLRGEASEDYLYFELTDKMPQHEAMAQLQQIYPHALAIEYVNLNEQADFKPSQAISSLKEKSVFQLFQDFFQEETNDTLSKDQEKLVKNLLDKAASLDLGG